MTDQRSDFARLCYALRELADYTANHLYNTHRPDQRGAPARAAYSEAMRPVAEARALLIEMDRKAAARSKDELAARFRRLERLPNGELRVRDAPGVHVTRMDAPVCQC
jgi:hypothetical protein